MPPVREDLTAGARVYLGHGLEHDLGGLVPAFGAVIFTGSSNLLLDGLRGSAPVHMALQSPGPGFLRYAASSVAATAEVSTAATSGSGIRMAPPRPA